MDNSSRNSKRKVVFRIQLIPTAKDRLSALSDRTAMTQVSLSSRLLEWFAMQDPTVQCAVLGLYPKAIEKEVAQLILDTQMK